MLPGFVDASNSAIKALDDEIFGIHHLWSTTTSTSTLTEDNRKSQKHQEKSSKKQQTPAQTLAMLKQLLQLTLKLHPNPPVKRRVT